MMMTEKAQPPPPRQRNKAIYEGKDNTVPVYSIPGKVFGNLYQDFLGRNTVIILYALPA